VKKHKVAWIKCKVWAKIGSISGHAANHLSGCKVFKQAIVTKKPQQAIVQPAF
jgi:hypothetical protein